MPSNNPEYTRKYCAANAEKLREQRRENYQRHKERYLAAAREQYRRDPEKAKARSRARYRQKSIETDVDANPLRIWRLAHGLKLREAAERFGYSISSISHMEHGIVRIPKKILEAIGK